MSEYVSPATAKARHRHQQGILALNAAFGVNVVRKNGKAVPPPPKVLRVLMSIAELQERRLSAHGPRRVKRRRQTLRARRRLAMLRRATVGSMYARGEL